MELAERFGTPLFVYDETEMRSRCREAVAAWGPGVAYATKAFLCKAMARVALEEGMNLDVATGGELHVAVEAGAPPDRLVLHGNNKLPSELVRALRLGVGRIVVDSFDEIARLEGLCSLEGQGSRPKVLLRVTPGVEAHTHEYVATGQVDSKFGFGLESGDAERAMRLLKESTFLELVGIHVHIGSQIFRLDAYSRTIKLLGELFDRLDAFGSLGLSELCVGGGLGVAYVEGEEAPTIAEWARTVKEALREAGVPSWVRVSAEPGRAIVAHAALTLYTVGTIKHIPGVRTYVAVDGGMSDNPRPVLYGSGYEAFLPRETFAERTLSARVVGRHCESGDVLVYDARLPADIRVGDILATPVTGAYGYSMASTYNRVPRPAVVFVRDGDARVVLRRETEEDLMYLEV